MFTQKRQRYKKYKGMIKRQWKKMRLDLTYTYLEFQKAIIVQIE